jgi:tripeptidyl-peptidase I
MLASLVWVVVAGLTTSVVAAPSTKHALKVKESIVVPRGWTRREEAPRHALLDLRIALPQPNFAVLEKHLYAVRSVGLLNAYEEWHI